jgi:hypothetical protein
VLSHGGLKGKKGEEEEGRGGRREREREREKERRSILPTKYCNLYMDSDW